MVNPVSIFMVQIYRIRLKTTKRLTPSPAAIEWFNRYLHNERGGTDVPQDIEKNKQVIRYFYEQSLKGNYAVYDELFTPDFHTTIDMIVAEKNLVAVYGVASGTHLGVLMGLPPSGKKVSWTGTAIHRFNDEGKIDGRLQEFDGLGLFQQLGLIPPMGGASASHICDRCSFKLRLIFRE
jgi:predicted ester cyclase